METRAKPEYYPIHTDHNALYSMVKYNYEYYMIYQLLTPQRKYTIILTCKCIYKVATPAITRTPTTYRCSDL
jgi:hypothetical protein